MCVQVTAQITFAKPAVLPANYAGLFTDSVLKSVSDRL